MYIEFTSKQLHEYNKIVANIESCENPQQHSTIVRMMKCFGKLCDRRASKLKRRGWIGLLKLQNKPMNEYYKYKHATKEQVQVLVDYSNMWLDQFEEWEKQQELDAQTKENYRGDKVDIVGFAKLLKKKRKK
jgi:hypothetical protein